ncbi:alkaline phosphatase [Chitinophaga pendula]|uniref:alkaline phosphatase n=1 Tax=Chitinophaga TaxID=79328 RepID=UPI000BB034A7|nr:MULTISPECIES: alkaline phosphatase [Chitinophaga]ASZ14180.1 alkaline phosphatase [Chitinophaga sp. MD30]UCJ08184.1 alkaline phosphatase [Chitinophaga pendula]
MSRRDFFRNSSLALLGMTLPAVRSRAGQRIITADQLLAGKKARNIIFMVSDGMSTGTLNMASLLMQRREGRKSRWMQLYEEGQAVRALMDTASASSLVTDSSAASSAWGGGVRVPNGAINVAKDGTHYKPILQKFKAAGKAVGCVTTVPITHATPAGFCISNSSRGDQSEIAMQYLPLKFDIMLGGGTEFFSADKRKDKVDLFARYQSEGYTVLRERDQLMQLKAQPGTPVLGVFYENGLPYSLDQLQDSQLQKQVPTLAEMTRQAIAHLQQHKNGFVMQVEGGKVDWGAHSNDAGALLYDQIAFDDAIKVAIDFAVADKETLVIMTTDHGNANPGLFYSDQANAHFDQVGKFKHTNEWILSGVTKDYTPAKLIERVEVAQGIVITTEEARTLLSHYETLDETGLYNPRKLPYRQLAAIQSAYTSIGWGSMDHSGDYVELAMYGPGSELLKPFVKNTDLHYLMLEAAGMKSTRIAG